MNQWRKKNTNTVGLAFWKIANQEQARRIRWQRVAIVAILACPGSFIAGGLLLGQIIGWWW